MLGSVEWARPLLDRVARSGGITRENLPLLFEVRVAYELHRVGMIADYEFAAGVGKSTLDFRVSGRPDWLIETVSVQESDATKAATTELGGVARVALATSASDAKGSEEGELLLLEQKITEKVWHSGAPTKFPVPGGALHLILVDTRGFNLGIGDHFDYNHATHGISALPDEVYFRYWQGTPIKGLFERENPLLGARLVQDRIHFVGFVRESEYRNAEISEKTYLCPNPHLFMDNDTAREAYESFALKRLGS